MRLLLALSGDRFIRATGAIACGDWFVHWDLNADMVPSTKRSAITHVASGQRCGNPFDCTPAELADVIACVPPPRPPLAPDEDGVIATNEAKLALFDWRERIFEEVARRNAQKQPKVQP